MRAVRSAHLDGLSPLTAVGPPQLAASFTSVGIACVIAAGSTRQQNGLSVGGIRGVPLRTFVLHGLRARAEPSESATLS
jgi:hypothetical protein